MKTEPNDPINAFTNSAGYQIDRDEKDAYPNVMSGLTKREHFAALAMQGLCAGIESHFQPEYFAQYAVMYADALINELNKEKI